MHVFWCILQTGFDPNLNEFFKKVDFEEKKKSAYDKSRKKHPACKEFTKVFSRRLAGEELNVFINSPAERVSAGDIR